MQERLRGMKASLKLGSSFLIHVETTKGVNPAIGKPWEVFYELRTRFGRVWRPPTTILYIKEWTRVFWPTACVRRVKAAYAWSTPAYAGLSTRPQEGRQNRIPFPIWSVIPPSRLLSWFPWPKGLHKAQSSSDFKHQGPRKIKLHKYNYPHEL